MTISKSLFRIRYLKHINRHFFFLNKKYLDKEKEFADEVDSKSRNYRICFFYYFISFLKLRIFIIGKYLPKPTTTRISFLQSSLNDSVSIKIVVVIRSSIGC